MRYGYRNATVDDIPSFLEMHALKPWSEENAYWLGVVGREYRLILERGDPLTLIVSTADDEESNEYAAVVVVVLVNDDFVDEILQADKPYTNQKMERWVSEGRNPFMSRQDIARANSTTGVNMLPITYAWDRNLPPDKAGHIRQLALHRFADKYSGYNLRRMIAEPCDRFLLQGCYEVGYKLINSYEAWAEENGMTEHPNRPFLLVAEREDALGFVNSFLLRMFAYEPPQLGLSFAQQDVLLLAMEGQSDSDIAEQLCIGADALKARWKSIYRRVESQLPGLLPEGEGGSRGIEKRRVLLQHLRDRPEELRPHL